MAVDGLRFLASGPFLVEGMLSAPADEESAAREDISFNCRVVFWTGLLECPRKGMPSLADTSIGFYAQYSRTRQLGIANNTQLARASQLSHPFARQSTSASGGAMASRGGDTASGDARESGKSVRDLAEVAHEVLSNVYLGSMRARTGNQSCERARGSR